MKVTVTPIFGKPIIFRGVRGGLMDSGSQIYVVYETTTKKTYFPLKNVISISEEE